MAKNSRLSCQILLRDWGMLASQLRAAAATDHTSAPGRVGSSRKRSLAACNSNRFPFPTFDTLLPQRVDRHALPGLPIAGVRGLVRQGGILLSWHRPS